MSSCVPGRAMLQPSLAQSLLLLSLHGYTRMGLPCLPSPSCSGLMRCHATASLDRRQPPRHAGLSHRRLVSQAIAVACRRASLICACGAITRCATVLPHLVTVPRHAPRHVTLIGVAPAGRAVPRQTCRASPILIIVHVWSLIWSLASCQACHYCGRTRLGRQFEFSLMPATIRPS